jgi:NADH:ubiquinone oxidoreductase subunit 6 (subunit J)
VISAPPLVTLALSALSTSLAMLMAHWRLLLVADVLVFGGAALGVTAFVSVGLSTLRSARQLRERPRRR